MRTCPRDGSRLRTERWSSTSARVDVDRCPTCGGHFLDEGEIRMLTGNRRLAKRLRRPSSVDLDSQLRCPDCKEMMEGENAGSIRIEICLGCFGLWLDAGELQRLQALRTKEIHRPRGAAGRRQGPPIPRGMPLLSSSPSDFASVIEFLGHATTQRLNPRR